MVVCDVLVHEEARNIPKARFTGQPESIAVYVCLCVGEEHSMTVAALGGGTELISRACVSLIRSPQCVPCGIL